MQILVSLVVRISACHVEGPGSIPGRGETLLKARYRPGPNFQNHSSFFNGCYSFPETQIPLSVNGKRSSEKQ